MSKGKSSQKGNKTKAAKTLSEKRALKKEKKEGKKLLE